MDIMNADDIFIVPNEDVGKAVEIDSSIKTIKLPPHLDEIDKDKFFYKFAVTPKGGMKINIKDIVEANWNGYEIEMSKDNDMFSYHYALHYYYTRLRTDAFNTPDQLFKLSVTNNKCGNKYGDIEMCAVFDDNCFVETVIITEDMTFVNIPDSVKELIYLGPVPKNITICYPAGREDIARQIKK